MNYYPYRPVGRDPLNPQRFLWMPYLVATINGPTDSRKVYALVDSGASFCMLNLAYATRIGIVPDRHTGIPTYGVTGLGDSKLAYPARVTVHIEHLGEMELPVFCMETDAFDLILGQRDFFDRFQVTFKKEEGTFEITP
jgi:hypothetical protein